MTLGDWEAMIQLITKQAPLMIDQGRYRPLKEWLDSLPKNLIENDPWLLYWKGTSRSPFDPPLAQPYLGQAFEKFKVQGNLPGALLAWSGVVYSIIYRFENYSPLDRWIQLFPELPENPEKIIPPESMDPCGFKHVHRFDISTSRAFGDRKMDKTC